MTCSLQCRLDFHILEYSKSYDIGLIAAITEADYLYSTILRPGGLGGYGILDRLLNGHEHESAFAVIIKLAMSLQSDGNEDVQHRRNNRM